MGNVIEIKQQNIRDHSRLPDSFVERALRICKNHERRVTDVHSICITMSENLVEDHFEIEKRAKFVMGFLLEDETLFDISNLTRVCFAKPVHLTNLLLVTFE